MSGSELQAQLDVAVELADTQPSAAVPALYSIIDSTASDADAVKVKEQAVSTLTSSLAARHDAEGLKLLLERMKPMYSSMAKAKTAKVVRTVIDALGEIPDTAALQIEVCKEQIAWTRAEKRNFLRHRIEMRLASLYIETASYQDALALVNSLLTEIKRLDDKLLLVDLHLIESRLHHLLLNQPKSKAALTAARSAANSVYVPPSLQDELHGACCGAVAAVLNGSALHALQAEIDLQSGTLHAEEEDYKTAYSYFLEAFEQYNNLGAPKALRSLKYMLLCKIMADEADDVSGLIASKARLKFGGDDVEAMRMVADARSQSSLTKLKEALSQYRPQLEGDPVVKRHLNDLFKALMEQNLIRIVQPYSKVEVAHLAKLIALDTVTVEREISQMILDKKIAGTLDQGTGCLEVFEAKTPDALYPSACDIVQNLDSVVDSLFARCQKLIA